MRPGKSSDRAGKPSTGSAQLAFFDDKFHKKAIKNARSTLKTQINDTSWIQRKIDLRVHRRDRETQLKAIDAKNLRMFVRLSQITPVVPQVVKFQATNKQNHPLEIENEPVHSEDQTDVQVKKIRQSTNMANILLSSHSSNPQKNSIVQQALMQKSERENNPQTVILNSNQMSTLNKTYTDLKLVRRRQITPTAKHIRPDFGAHSRNKSAESPSKNASKVCSDSKNQQTSAYQKTTRWFLKSPKKKGYFDDAFKVAPTLNMPERLKRMNQIQRDNARFHDKIVNVRGSINLDRILQESAQNEKQKRNIQRFDHKTGQSKLQIFQNRLKSKDKENQKLLYQNHEQKYVEDHNSSSKKVQ